MAHPGNSAGPILPPESLADLVRSLASVMEQTAISELDLDFGSVTIRLRRPPLATVDGRAQTDGSDVATTVDEVLSGHVITAPMIGTFYASPAPGAPPFVHTGDHVAAGQTIGIIEAMKIMNEIAADRSGVVQTILVDNGQPVEYGSPLMQLSLGRSDRS